METTPMATALTFSSLPPFGSYASKYSSPYVVACGSGSAHAKIFFGARTVVNSERKERKGEYIIIMIL
jgi:hypothetical protein